MYPKVDVWTHIDRLRVAPLFTKMRENRLRLFEHVHRKAFDALMRRIESIIVESKISQ